MQDEARVTQIQLWEQPRYPLASRYPLALVFSAGDTWSKNYVHTSGISRTGLGARAGPGRGHATPFVPRTADSGSER